MTSTEKAVVYGNTHLEMFFREIVVFGGMCVLRGTAPPAQLAPLGVTLNFISMIQLVRNVHNVGTHVLFSVYSMAVVQLHPAAVL